MYSDSIRKEFGLPVFDIISSCNFVIEGFKDNVLFGENNWQDHWDGKHNEYTFGQHLSTKERSQLINTIPQNAVENI